MAVWEADFYRRPLQADSGEPLWELLVCRAGNGVVYEAQCPQAQASAAWLRSQLQAAAQHEPPERVRVFRPQAVSLFQTVAPQVGATVEPTRRTRALKQELQRRAARYPRAANYTGEPRDLTQLDRPPPQPLPEAIWGEQWRFASLPAGDLANFRERPIPICQMPEALLPLELGIASTAPVPGAIVYGGRQAMQLAQWLAEAQPVTLNHIPTEAGRSGGLVLEAGLADRWVFATFDDADVAQAAQTYEQRKQAAQGLHFLLVQPDDSGKTDSGFWLLRDE